MHSHVIPAKIVEQIAIAPKAFAARIEGEAHARKVIHEQGYVYPLLTSFTWSMPSSNRWTARASTFR